MLLAVATVNDVIAPRLVGLNPSRQDEIDKLLDGTPNKAKLSANAILGASMAVGRSAAHDRRVGTVRLRSADVRLVGSPDER